MPITALFADATNEQVGIFIAAAAIVTGCIAAGISVASNFATRREVEDLKTRVDKIEVDLDDKTTKIHKRVNRLLAGQMLIAGRIGCSLDQHQDQITAWMAELEREED
jgi:outer membrane murein-binding lipoprotein Lpp